MKLGSNVSGLSTTAANAAGKGLSVIVPVYNEAAGLRALHERLIGLARSLRGFVDMHLEAGPRQPNGGGQARNSGADDVDGLLHQISA